MESKDRVLLALDFGDTKQVAAVRVDRESQWCAHRRALSPPYANASTDLKLMRSLIDDLLKECQPTAIGEVRLSHHVPGWENIPLSALLSEEFGVPVSVDNDANVAALGEHRFGAGQGYDSLMYITVGTGVGGGWVLNGQPWRGAEGRLQLRLSAKQRLKGMI